MSDTLSLDGGGSVTGVGGYTTPYRQGPVAGVPMDYPTHTVPRNYHYGPPGGYNDYRTGPPSETYASLTRGAHMDDRYRYYFKFIFIVGLQVSVFGRHISNGQWSHLNLQTSTSRWLQNSGS